LVRENSLIALTGQPRPQNYLQVRFYAAPRPEKFDCSEEQVCDGPLDLTRRLNYLNPQPQEQERFYAEFQKACYEIISGNPTQYQNYATTMSKGMRTLSDGVATIGPHGVELDDLVRRTPPGEHALEFCPTDQRGNYTCPDAPVDFDWQHRRLARGGGPFHQGLYRVKIYSMAGGMSRDSGDFAIVLLTPQDQYEQVRKQFDEAKNLTSDWMKTGDPEPTITALLRAYLVHLSVQIRLE
jgi:hypothetical protein